VRRRGLHRLPRGHVRSPPSELVSASMCLPYSEVVTLLYPSLSTSLLWRFSLLAAALPQSGSAASSRQTSRRPSLHAHTTSSHAGLPIMTYSGMISPHPPSSPPPHQATITTTSSPPSSLLNNGAVTTADASLTLLSDHLPSFPAPSLSSQSLAAPTPPIPGFLNSTSILTSLSSYQYSSNQYQVWTVHGYASPSHDTSPDASSLRLGRVDELGNYEAFLSDDANESQRQRATKPLLKTRGNHSSLSIPSMYVLYVSS
jgi:hypothetical protein